jgi:ElaB/YqjD/DUF883 family membrane-anchored ribosome-binding protein
VADELTPTIEKTPEEIERDMAHTRESMTEKVTALENQVVGTVQTAADTVTNTVEAVKSLVTQAPEAVSDTVKKAAAAVSETVKDTFDITGHVRRHPWAAVGTSALIGCIVGCLVSRRAPTAVPPTPAYFPPAAPPEARRPEVPREPGMLDEVFEMIGGKVKELAHTALETVSTAIKQNIETGVPKFVDDAASRLTEPAAG